LVFFLTASVQFSRFKSDVWDPAEVDVRRVTRVTFKNKGIQLQVCGEQIRRETFDSVAQVDDFDFLQIHEDFVGEIFDQVAAEKQIF
jgi:hypothetical protein